MNKVTTIYKLWNDILECNPDLTYSEWSEKASPIIDALLKEEAIKFEIFLMKEWEDINSNPKSVEHAYDNWKQLTS